MYSLFDTHADAGLAWVRKYGSQYIPAVDVNLTMSLAMIMQVCACALGVQLSGWLFAPCANPVHSHRNLRGSRYDARACTSTQLLV